MPKTSDASSVTRFRRVASNVVAGPPAKSTSFSPAEQLGVLSAMLQTSSEAQQIFPRNSILRSATWKIPQRQSTRFITGGVEASAPAPAPPPGPTLPNYYEVTAQDWTDDWYPYLTTLITANSSLTFTANRTLTNTVTSAGWYGGVLGTNGLIYCIPYSATTIAIINPSTSTVTRSALGATLTGTTKWLGGVLASNGKIYGIPYSSQDFLIIDPVAGTATRSTLGLEDFQGGWNAGALAPDGKIYCPPASGSTGILIIDPVANTATVNAMGLDFTNFPSWQGANLGPDGKIYCMPGTAVNPETSELYSTDVLIINPSTGTATTTSFGLDFTDLPYWGGATLGPNGKIYGVPAGQTDFLIIDPLAGTASRSALGATFSSSWAGGTIGPNGRIYMMPADATSILIIDTTDTTASPHGTASLSALGATLTGSLKWFGGVLGQNGTIYGVPYNSTNILRIVPSATPTLDATLPLTPYFNNF